MQRKAKKRLPLKTRLASSPAEEAKVRLAAITESSEDAIIGKTLDGIITHWNKGAQRIYGYTATETIGRHISLLTPKDRADEIPQILTRIKNGESIYHYETLRRHKDGRVFPVALTILPLKNSQRKIIGASTIARDITERKRADEMFRLVVESAPNALIMTGPEGKITLVNSQAEKLFGYSRNELLGQTIEMLIPERIRSKHVSYRSQFFAEPATRAMGAGRDLFGLRKDGTEVPVEIGLNPIKTDEGAFVLASIIDITERRTLEKKIVNAESMAAVGSMVTIVSHEIRNPLGSIVMAAKALARGSLSQEDHAQVVSVLSNESQRLSATLEDFLQFARPREPKLEIGDINATTHEVLLAVKSDDNLIGKAVVKESLDRSLPGVPFDPAQIRQVLWNIIRNGLQALDGKGSLEVETEVRSGQVLIHIKDSGPGIPKDQMDKLFMPFYTTKTKGTGLGLPISRKIVRSHGGDIQVSSDPGRGSRFSVVLPVSRHGKNPARN